MDYKSDLIERLKMYKEQFMADVDRDDLRSKGVVELHDYLDGIQEEYDGKVHSCIVSYLVFKLSDDDLQDINSQLSFEIKLDRDNQDYYSTYDIDVH